MEETGITATAGIGTNLYLAKIAMDIVAKHIEDHIGMLDEISYREQLWGHKPLSDFLAHWFQNREKISRIWNPNDGRYRTCLYPVGRLAV